MKRKISKLKKEAFDAKKIIGVDQPFDYDEVASITGPEYIRNLSRDGLSGRPYEELKKSTPGFQIVEDKCIWMKAGIINFRFCDHDSDCCNCPFDQAMRSAMGEKAPPKIKEGQTDWTIRLKEKYQIVAKPCIHFKSGCIESPEECTSDYECYHCNNHQMLYPKNQAKIIDKPKYTNVSGLQVAADYYHHVGHSWVHVEHDGWVRIGIDAFISKIFGPADTISLPPAGTYLKQGEVGWILARNGLEAPMLSPLSGTVFVVNEKIRKQPEAVQDDPYNEGWLFLLDPANLKLNLKGLYFGKECFQWIEKENQNLLALLGAKYERLAATGGGLIDDIYGSLPEPDRHRLVCKFLYTAQKR